MCVLLAHHYWAWVKFRMLYFVFLYFVMMMMIMMMSVKEKGDDAVDLNQFKIMTHFKTKWICEILHINVG